MGKLKIPSRPNVGKPLTFEEMRNISVASSAGGKCGCTLYLTDGRTYETAVVDSYHESACPDYCQDQCNSMLNCYKFASHWTDNPESGSSCGSDDGSGSSEGSGSDTDGKPLYICMCTKDCKFIKDCRHRLQLYACKSCYCTGRCNYFKSKLQS